MITLDVAGLPKTSVQPLVSPLAELLANLHVLVESGHHPEETHWSERVLALFDDKTNANLQRFAPLWARYRFRGMLPTDVLPETDLDAELQQLDDMPEEVFLKLAAQAIRGTTNREPNGQPSSLGAQWVEDCRRHSFGRGDLAESLVMDPARFRRELVAFLFQCKGLFFGEEWEKAGPVIRNAAQLIRNRLDGHEAVQVIASITPIASTREGSTVVVFDKVQSSYIEAGQRSVLLVPSVRSWPHVIIKADKDLPIIVHFPVQALDMSARADSQEVVRERLRVLVEPARWELCRHLVNEPITTSELALRMGISRAAVSRHLTKMRDCGLVHSTKTGRQVFHRLDARSLFGLGRHTMNALLR